MFHEVYKFCRNSTTHKTLWFFKGVWGWLQLPQIPHGGQISDLGGDNEIRLKIPGINAKARSFFIQITYPDTDPILIPGVWVWIWKIYRSTKTCSHTQTDTCACKVITHELPLKGDLCLKLALARQSSLTEMCSHQAEWREEVKQHFEKIKSEGTCLHRLDEELINRRREELRSVQPTGDDTMVAYMDEATFALCHFSMSFLCPPLFHEINALSAHLLWSIWNLSCGCTMTSAASFFSQACFGHSRALWEETGEG